MLTISRTSRSLLLTIMTTRTNLTISRKMRSLEKSGRLRKKFKIRLERRVKRSGRTRKREEKKVVGNFRSFVTERNRKREREQRITFESRPRVKRREAN